MGTTPYEQRFNYYMAAKDQLSNQYHAQLNEAQIKMQYGDQGAAVPDYPNPDQIFQLAEEIKTFAEKK
jgi:hypothetical protein